MKKNILIYLEQNLEASPKQIAYDLKISRQLVHRYLNQLMTEGKVSKIGKSPLVFYQYIEKRIDTTEAKLQHSAEETPAYNTLDFIEITVDGKYLKGMEAFTYWCSMRNQPLEKTLKEYKKTISKYEEYKKERYIDGTQKLLNTKGFTKIGLEKLFYIDFYAIERFGKTKLGKLMHYGKQSQSIKLIDEIISLSLPTVEKIIKEYKIDAVGYIPPTLPREVQIMSEFEHKFAIELPHIKLIKIKGEIVVPQKALSKIQDRILNTQKSIVVVASKQYDTILLIDDAVGSGATLNETANKIKAKRIAKTVYGLAVTGSYKGFEVISEA